MSGQIKTKELIATETVIVAENNLVLYNDDVNSFEFVIETLVEVCGHDFMQAEQCAHLVHYKGKCSVKTGNFKELEPLCFTLLEKGLSAKIE